MMVRSDHLTANQATKLAVTDAWFMELDDLIDRLRAGEPVYKPLSPMWKRESAEVWMPDEVFDPLRK